jgi:hypothetical protein
MKKAGSCIKCSSSEVYSNRNEHSRGTRSVMAGPGGKMSTRLFIQVYAFLDCGYFEEYIEGADLNNEKKIGKVKSSWERLN